MPDLPMIIPDGLPFYLAGGPVGCVLFHGLTAMPGEMRWLGNDLHVRGHTVLGVRLAGHGTHPADLARTRWTDWLVNIEEALALLHGNVERVVVIGQSLGGIIALLAAGTYPDRIDGVVAIACPYDLPTPDAGALKDVPRELLVRKGVPPHRELGIRREAVYPAYAAESPHILPEVGAAMGVMRDRLAVVQAPVLLVHSHDDQAVPVDNAQRLYDKLECAEKEMLLLDGLGHSIVRHPRRRPAFDAIGAFIAGIAARAPLTETGSPE